MDLSQLMMMLPMLQGRGVGGTAFGAALPEGPREGMTGMAQHAATGGVGGTPMGAMLPQPMQRGMTGMAGPVGSFVGHTPVMAMHRQLGGGIPGLLGKLF